MKINLIILIFYCFLLGFALHLTISSTGNIIFRWHVIVALSILAIFESLSLIKEHNRLHRVIEEKNEIISKIQENNFNVEV